MNNEELIKALRYCAEHEGCDYYIAKDCPRESTWMCGVDCGQILMLDAADALEADEKHINELTTKCNQLQAAVDNYEKRIAELEKQEPTEKQVVDYCRKRCLVIIEEELFQRMKSTFSRLPKEGEWIMDEHPHDGDCRCSVCLIAIDAMHERNHGRLNALTGGKWWKFYHYCPNCGARMKGEETDDGIHVRE